MQWNARGIKSKENEFQHYVSEINPVDIFAIQESNLKCHHKFKIRGYQIIRLDAEICNNNGLTIGIKDYMTFKEISRNTNERGERLTVKVNLKNQKSLHVTNIYKKGANTKKETINFLHEIDTDLENHVILGDFNSSHSWWGNKTNTEGIATQEFIVDRNLTLLNTGEPTRIAQRSRETDSSLDLTLLGNNKLSTNFKWETIEDTMGSDHKMIITSWQETDQDEEQPEVTPKFNIKKADWKLYEQLAITSEWDKVKDDDIDKYHDNIVEIITNIATQAIPNNLNGRKKHPKPKKAKKTVSWWTQECTEAKLQRIKALKEFQTHRTEANLKAYREARNRATKTIRDTRQKNWQEYCTTLNTNTKIKEVWNTIKGIEGTKKQSNKINPIKTSENSEAKSDKDIANALGDHYQHVSSDDNLSLEFKVIKEKHKIEKSELLRNQNNDEKDFNRPVTLKELKNVLYKKKQTAPGHDALQYILFKKLPSEGKRAIVEFYNQIWQTGKIPKKFKHAIIIPIYKKGKDKSEAASYRPISLTSHLGKTLETIISKRLNIELERNNHISPNQSGFRKKRQTHDQILRVAHEVEKCKLLKKSTVALFLDLEKAYDLLWREGTLEELQKLNITGNMFNYVKNFLEERTFQVKVGQKLSETKEQKNGTAQGSVLSPTLFNILINDLSQIEKKHPKVAIGQFADDTALWVKAKHAPNKKNKRRNEILKETIKAPISEMLNKLKAKGFKVNVQKTQAMFFNNPDNPTLNINGTDIKATETIKYLGIKFDKKLNYAHHIEEMYKKAYHSLNIIRCTAGKNWGANSKVKRLIYRNLILPKMTYGEEFYDQGTKTQLDKLQRIQNSALRMIVKAPQCTGNLALSVLTKIPPLAVRRAERKVKLWARIMHNSGNIARQTYNDRDLKRTGQHLNTKNGIVESTHHTLETLGIREDQLAKSPPQRPLWTLNNINIDLTLKEKISKKTLSTKEMKEITLRHIKDNYADRNHIYTDGSKEKGTVGCGFYNEGHNTGTYARISNHCSILTAELQAIKGACDEALKDDCHPKTVVLTDSQSAALSLKTQDDKNSRFDIVQQILICNDKIIRREKEITILWIPAHCDIPGNDMADQLANTGRKQNKVSINTKLDPSEIKCLLSNKVRDKIMQPLWTNSSKGIFFKKIVPKVETIINYGGSLEKITRMRLYVPHFFLKRNKICVECDRPLTIEHVLIHCSIFKINQDKIKRQLCVEEVHYNVQNILSPHRSKQSKELIRELIQEINGLYPV